MLSRGQEDRLETPSCINSLYQDGIFHQNNVLCVPHSAPIPFGLEAQQSDIMAIGTLGLELFNTYLGSVTKHYQQIIYLKDNLSGIIISQKVILTKNHENVFINNASETVSCREDKSVRDQGSSTLVLVSAASLRSLTWI